MEDTTRAMFLPLDQKPWYGKVKDYMVHPEYDYTTMSTIALIELDLEYVTHFPVTPVCWPLKNHNTTDLYVIGFTDENKILEKMVYRADYVSQDVCKEFYERQQPLIVDRVEVHNSMCAVAKSNKKNCEWDNGMVMASNSTGIWTLIGFSLQGPSCSAPSRFLDLTNYLSWIEMITTLDPEDNIYRKSGGDVELHENSSKETQYNAYRKSADVTDFNEDSIKDSQYSAFSKPGEVSEFYQDSSKKPEYNNLMKYTGDTDIQEDYSNEEPKDDSFRKSEDDTEFHENYSSNMNGNKNDMNDFRVQRIAYNAISINFNKTADSGDCTISKMIVYSESMPLRLNKTNFGIVLLKIPIVDLVYKDYNCVSLEVKSKTKSAYLWYNITKNNSNKLQRAVSKGISTFKRRHHNRKRHPSTMLYLKLKFVFAADFNYLVFSKESKKNIEKDNSNINKALSKLKNKIKSTKVSAIVISNSKLKLRIKGDKNGPPSELTKRNVKIIDDMEDLKRTLRINNLKMNKTIVPLALNYHTNKEDGNINSIKSVILSIYNNNVTMNVFVSLSITFTIVYVLFSVFVRKGYVRL